MATSVETAAEHERILREIESTDTNCIGPTLRSVYDGREHGLFVEELDVRIRNHDREIEKMCNHHFQGFVDSITELLKVRGEAQKLKSQVTETNRHLQDEGKELMGSMEELQKCRVQQRNIASTIDKLTHCLPVLEMYSRLQEQMRAKRTQIRDTAMTQLRDFLESIRKHSDKIGETAIKQVFSRSVFTGQGVAGFSLKVSASELIIRKLFLELWELAKIQRSLDSSVSSQPRALIGRRRKEAMMMNVNGIDGTPVPGAQDLVDFSPVYRCLHIYTVLGLRDVFENYYRKQRRKQARLVLQPHSNMHETLEGYTRYFNQIVGFFVVEDHILHTTQGLVNRAYVEELWELALSKLIAALRTHSSYCDNPNLVLDLKNLIGYGFPVSQLFDMLLEMREQYGEILLKKWNITFRQVLDQDNFSPIPVSTEQEYKNYTSQFPLQDPELDKLPFPKKLPFSEFVPKVYCQLKEFIYACLKYSEDLHLSSTEVDDMIRKSTNLLLTRTLSHCLHYAIKKKNVGLDARHSAEAEIYTNLNAKIDQFLQLAEYDWMVALQGGGTSEASDYLMDLI
ncbi:hypothetical protein JOQ06_020720, partial [Pogonophryne albipinna]